MKKKNKMAALGKKITEQEVLDNAHDSEHHLGMNANFKKTFMLLDQMGVFRPDLIVLNEDDEGYYNDTMPQPSAAQIVCRHLYDFEELTNDDLKTYEAKAKKKPQTYGLKRLERLRNGRASFLKKEARYFHLAFRFAFGNEWADALSEKEVVMGDINHIITRLIETSLEISWNDYNTVQVLRLLAAGRAGKQSELDLKIQAYSDTRLSRQFPGPARKLSDIDDVQCLKFDQEFRLRIKGITPDQDCFVLEYSTVGLTDDNRSTTCQAQVMKHISRHDDRAYITGKDDELLVVEPTSGYFGFCVIACDAKFNLANILNIGTKDENLSVEDFQLLTEILTDKRNKISGLRISMLDYKVVA